MREQLRHMPTFNGIMKEKEKEIKMTVTVSFEAAQAQLSNSSTGVQLAQVILPYSIRNSQDSTKYLGGQMTLFPSDGIKLTDNTKDWEHLALIKIKDMVTEAEIYEPNQIIEDEPVVDDEVPEDEPVVDDEPSEGSAEEDTVDDSAE